MLHFFKVQSTRNKGFEIAGVGKRHKAGRGASLDKGRECKGLKCSKTQRKRMKERRRMEEGFDPPLLCLNIWLHVSLPFRKSISCGAPSPYGLLNKSMLLTETFKAAPKDRTATAMVKPDISWRHTPRTQSQHWSDLWYRWVSSWKSTDLCSRHCHSFAMGGPKGKRKVRVKPR